MHYSVLIVRSSLHDQQIRTVYHLIVVQLCHKLDPIFRCSFKTKTRKENPRPNLLHKLNTASKNVSSCGYFPDFNTAKHRPHPPVSSLLAWTLLQSVQWGYNATLISPWILDTTSESNLDCCLKDSKRRLCAVFFFVGNLIRPRRTISTFGWKVTKTFMSSSFLRLKGYKDLCEQFFPSVERFQRPLWAVLSFGWNLQRGSQRIDTADKHDALFFQFHSDRLLGMFDPASFQTSKDRFP